MSSDDFNKILQDFSLFKLEYNIQERNRERERAYQILGICLVIMSIVIATITAEPDAIKTLSKHHIISIIGLGGFALILFNLALCYHMMTIRTYNPIIDPQKLYEFYKDTPLSETRDKIRGTLFAMLAFMDETNDKFRTRVRVIHIMTPICLVAIFIPVIALIMLK